MMSHQGDEPSEQPQQGLAMMGGDSDEDDYEPKPYDNDNDNDEDEAEDDQSRIGHFTSRGQEDVSVALSRKAWRPPPKALNHRSAQGFKWRTLKKLIALSRFFNGPLVSLVTQSSVSAPGRLAESSSPSFLLRRAL